MKLGLTKKVLKKASAVLLLAGVMLTISACVIRPIGWSSHKVNLNQEEKFNFEKLKRITVGTASADIKIIVTDEKEARFHYYGNVRVASADKDFEPYIDVDESSSSLALAEKISNGLNSVSYSGSVKLDIYVPKSYSENIKLNTASGSVEVKNFEGSCDINTASGEINAENCGGDFAVNTASGHISYSKNSVLNNKLNLNSVSGAINVSIPKNSEFSLKARTVSGKIKCDFPIVLDGKGLEGTVGSGKNSISVNTVSGSITIKNN